MLRRVGLPWEICTHSQLPVARYKDCTNTSYILKGSFEEGEPKNVNLQVVQKEHLPVWACKLLRLVQRLIGPPVEICAHSELPVAR